MLYLVLVFYVYYAHTYLHVFLLSNARYSRGQQRNPDETKAKGMRRCHKALQDKVQRFTNGSVKLQ